METPAGVRKSNGTVTNQKRKPPMKAKSSRFDSLVARYYPAVYSFASRLTDDPREAIALTRNAFRSAQKQLCSLRDQTAVATILILAVIRAGLTAG
jgi:DNA-directed RNA polymerase specialized sigma24 family protein